MNVYLKRHISRGVCVGGFISFIFSAIWGFPEDVLVHVTLTCRKRSQKCVSSPSWKSEYVSLRFSGIRKFSKVGKRRRRKSKAWGIRKLLIKVLPRKTVNVNARTWVIIKRKMLGTLLFSAVL